MTLAVLVDSGPLGQIIHPNEKQRQRIEPILRFASEYNLDLLIPDKVFEETYQSLIKIGSEYSLRRLDEWEEQEKVVPLKREDYVLACLMERELERKAQRISSKPPPSNDALIAAQLITITESGEYNKVLLLTQNAKHFNRLCKLCNNNILVWGYNQALLDAQGGGLITLTTKVLDLKPV